MKSKDLYEEGLFKMARHITYSDSQILQGAYDFVRLNGWNKVTARNVAKQIGSSTQPIYKQYATMDELKQQVVKKVTRDFDEHLLETPLDSNLFLNVALTYIDFAKREPNLFEGIWEKKEFSFKQTKQSSYSDFVESFTETLDSSLTKKQSETIFQTTWATIIGLSKLQLKMTTKATKQLIVDVKKGLEHSELVKNRG